MCFHFGFRMLLSLSFGSWLCCCILICLCLTFFFGWLIRAFWFFAGWFRVSLLDILAWFVLNLTTFWFRFWNCRKWVSSLGRSSQHVGTCVFAVLLWGQDHASRSNDTENCLLIYSLSPLYVFCGSFSLIIEIVISLNSFLQYDLIGNKFFVESSIYSAIISPLEVEKYFFSFAKRTIWNFLCLLCIAVGLLFGQSLYTVP